jgi:tetratricopeptide (TPR) repeat protein
VTPAPVTPAPVTPAPVTPAPVTPAPVTPAPVTPDNGGAGGGSVLPVQTSPVVGAGGPAPSPPGGNPNVNRNAADLAAVQPLIAAADRDVDSGDLIDAYALYRQAINLAPLSDVPRLKLAQAYLQGGQTDLALSEARRALEVVPDSAAVQAFLTQYDTQNGTQFGKVVRDQALAVKDPQDPAVHLNLGDALWSQGRDADAEAEFVQARDLARPDSLVREKAVAHLAGLHAATGRYTDALAEMAASGDLGYPLVLTVVQNAVDDLAGDLDRAQDEYAAGKLTRADLYGKVQADEAKAQALADFVVKISPPAAYAHSHLDRVQAVTLFSQAAAELTGYLETNDPTQQDKAVQLEKDAQTEMLTAHAAEQKLGLWNAATRLGEDSR